MKRLIHKTLDFLLRLIPEPSDDSCPHCGYYCNCNSAYCLPPDDKPKQEKFYHPTTGYCGTKSEMDTYIINRERKLKDE